MLFKGYKNTRLVQSGSSGDNFNELASDDGLSGSVEGQRQLVNHLAGVLAGIVHGAHARRLLGAGALLHREEDQRGQRELQIVLNDVRVERIVGDELIGRLECGCVCE